MLFSFVISSPEFVRSTLIQLMEQNKQEIHPSY